MVLEIGDMCWIPVTANQQTVSVPNEFFVLGENCSLAFLPVRLVRVEGVAQNIGVFHVEWDSRQEIKCNMINVQERNWPTDEGKLPESIDEISMGNVASIVYALSLRHQEGKCMSLMSSLLLYTNPMGLAKFKTGAYENKLEYMDEVYDLSSRNVLTSLTTQNNVIFPIVEKLRSSVLAKNRYRKGDDAAITNTLIFRGCSGSGKTEAIKAAIQYMMYVDTLRSEDKEAKDNALEVLTEASAASRNREGYSYLGGGKNPVLRDNTLPSTRAVEGAHLHDSITAAMLLLDVMTTRPTSFNGRSTRSLNRYRLMLNLDTGRLEGIEVVCLLLDKAARSMGTNPTGGRHSGEPYLIFPMVLAHASEDTLSSAGISEKVKFSYLGACRTMTEEQLEQEMEHFKGMMLLGGVSQQQWDDFINCILAIVLLQTIAIVGNDSAFIGGPSVQVLECAEKVLKTPKGALKEILLKNDMGRLGIMNHKPDGSREVVGGLCISIYYRACATLSEAVTGKSFFDEALTTMSLSGGDSALEPHCTSLELVDTMGYEETDVGEAGTLAELTTNYTAERFFYQYSREQFQATIEAYAADGVKMADFEPPDYLGTVELFDQLKTGLVHLTAEVSMSMRPDDKQIGDKFIAEHGKSKMVRPAGMKSKRSEFFVHHHFSDCLYDCEGYVKASKTPNYVNKAVEEFLNKSDVALVKDIGETIMAQGAETDQTGRAADARGKPGPSMNKVLQAKGLVMTRAKDVLTKTLGVLGNSDISYVLCLRPNQDPTEYHFDPKLMTSQVKHHALDELHRMSWQGLGTQLSYGDFYRKFARALSPYFDIEQQPRTPDIKEASEVLDKCLVEAKERGIIASDEEAAQFEKDASSSAQFGLKNIYYKSSLSRILEAFFAEKTGLYARSAAKLVATYKSYKIYMRFKTIVRGAVLVASHCRRKILTRRFQRQRYLVSRLRANIYCRKQRRLYLEWKDSINLIKATVMRPQFFRYRMRFVKWQRSLLSFQMLARAASITQQANYVMSRVLIMQRSSIRFVTRCRVYYLKQAAAMALQSSARGFLWRLLHPKTMHLLAMKKKLRRAMRATIALQKRFRCRNITRKFQQIRVATRVLQHWMVGRLDRLRHLKMRKAIRWFQCSTRRILATDKVSFMMAARMMRDETARLMKVREAEIDLVVRRYTRAQAKERKYMANPDFMHSSNVAGSVGNGPEQVFDSGHASFVVGSGLLRNQHTLFLKTLAAFDIGADITHAYPEGFLSRVVSHNAALNGQTNYLVKLALGASHTLLLDDKHNIYGFGLGDGGELGNETLKSYAKPTLLKVLMRSIKKDDMFWSKERVPNKLHNVPVKEVVCGREHTCLLSQSGLVWTWGRNTRGQLGHSEFETAPSPKLIRQGNGRDPVRNVTHLAVGSMHSACIDDKGTLYTWGSYECLGMEPPPDVLDADPEASLTVKQVPKFKYRPDKSVPTVVAFFATNTSTGRFVVSHLTCGDSHVSVIATPILKTAKVGTHVYSWGNNSYGQLGIDDRRCVLAFTPRRTQIPVLIEGVNTRKPDAAATVTGAGVHFKEIQLVSGGRHMVLLLKNRLWAWGWNKFGQLGVGVSDTDVFGPVAVDMTRLTQHIDGEHKVHLEAIRSISAGWKVSAAVNNAGDLFLWGAPGTVDSGASVPASEMQRAARSANTHSIDYKKALYGEHFDSPSSSPRSASSSPARSPQGGRGRSPGSNLDTITEGADDDGLAVVRVPVFADTDDKRMGFPVGVHVYGNQHLTLLTVKGVDPRVADWSLSASGAVRQGEVLQGHEDHKGGHFHHHMSKVVPSKTPVALKKSKSLHASASVGGADMMGSTWGSDFGSPSAIYSDGMSTPGGPLTPGQSLTPFSPMRESVGGMSTPGSRSPAKKSANGPPRGTIGEKVYRGSLAVQLAEGRIRDTHATTNERLKTNSPMRKVKNEHGQHIGAEERTKPLTEEMAPKLPYHHRDSKAHHHKAEIKHHAKADDVLEQFKAAGLARGMHVHGFLKGRVGNTVTDTSPPPPMPPPDSPFSPRSRASVSFSGIVDTPAAAASPRSVPVEESKAGGSSPDLQLGLGRTGRYSMYTPQSPHAMQKVERARDDSKTSRAAPLPGSGVTDDGMRALLQSKPRNQGMIQLDPTKPSTQIFSRVSKMRKKGISKPSDQKLLNSLNADQLLSDYGTGLDELEDGDPFNIMHGKTRTHHHYTVDESFLNFVDEVVNADAQYDNRTNQFDHSDEDEDEEGAYGEEGDNADDRSTGAGSLSDAGSVGSEGMHEDGGYTGEEAKTRAQRKYEARRKAAYVKAAGADLAYGLSSSVQDHLKAGKPQVWDLDSTPGGYEEEDHQMDYLSDLRRELGLTDPRRERDEAEREKERQERRRQMEQQAADEDAKDERRGFAASSFYGSPGATSPGVGGSPAGKRSRSKMTSVEKAKERAAERNQSVMNRLGSYGFMPKEAQRATQLGKGLDSIHLSSVRDLSNQIASLKVEQLGRLMDEED